METTTNLLDGQPFSMENLRDVKEVFEEYGIPLVLDGSMLEPSRKAQGYR